MVGLFLSKPFCITICNKQINIQKSVNNKPSFLISIYINSVWLSISSKFIKCCFSFGFYWKLMCTGHLNALLICIAQAKALPDGSTTSVAKPHLKWQTGLAVITSYCVFFPLSGIFFSTQQINTIFIFLYFHQITQQTGIK